MSTLIEVAEEAERREPLLNNPSPPIGQEDEKEITPSSTANTSETLPSSNQRLLSLDIFRGLTVALMILVDDAGGAFPSINHSPWFGVTIADFVMPFFLFGVGVSVGLVFKKVTNKWLATKKVVLRTIKLFLLGLLLQGGYFHGRNNLTYGVDVLRIRVMGILQRISIGYLFASMTEIWLVHNIMVDSLISFTKKYYLQWMLALFLGSIYLCFLYGIYVPNWEFEALNTNLLGYRSGTSTVNCGMRGSLEPSCNAVGFIDRLFLGQNHLYQRPVYRRTKECSVNSPDYGPLPPNSPAWCLAPFDPEGTLSSLMAAITCFLGLHFGHVLVHFKDQVQSVFLWCMSSFPLLIAGYALEFLGVPFSKPLYTLSYMCITAAASGLCLTIIYYVVDVKKLRKPLMMFQWMGMNALIIFALAASDLLPVALQGFYWHIPKNNLVEGTKSLLQAILQSEKWGTLAFVILEILFWGLVAGFLHMKGIYFKL